MLTKLDFFDFFTVFAWFSRVNIEDSVLIGLDDNCPLVESDVIVDIDWGVVWTSTDEFIGCMGLPNRSTFDVNGLGVDWETKLNEKDVWTVLSGTGAGVCGRKSYQLPDWSCGELFSNGRFDDTNGTDSTNGDISPTVI